MYRQSGPCVGRSMICEVYVFSTYKAAGVFGDLDFEASDIDPSSAFKIDIYNKSYIFADPRCAAQGTPGRCQLVGNWSNTLPGFSTIPPYPRMGNRCQSLPPGYPRISASGNAQC